MIPHAELNIIPGAGHMVMLEEPEKFNDAMIVFINNVIADSYQFKRNVL
jgi:pimeloyl-ACP methyl ester carboxylesterase